MAKKSKKKKGKKAKKVVMFDQEAFFDNYRDHPRNNYKPVAEEVHLPTAEIIEHYCEEEKEEQEALTLIDSYFEQ